MREAICESYWEKYDVEVSPERVLITSGTSPAMLLVFSVLIEEGEEVILSDPCYPCYPNFVNYLGGRVIFIRTEEG